MVPYVNKCNKIKWNILSKSWRKIGVGTGMCGNWTFPWRQQSLNVPLLWMAASSGQWRAPQPIPPAPLHSISIGPSRCGWFSSNLAMERTDCIADVFWFVLCVDCFGCCVFLRIDCFSASLALRSADCCGVSNERRIWLRIPSTDTEIKTTKNHCKNIYTSCIAETEGWDCVINAADCHFQWRYNWNTENRKKKLTSCAYDITLCRLWEGQRGSV